MSNQQNLRTTNTNQARVSLSDGIKRVTLNKDSFNHMNVAFASPSAEHFEMSNPASVNIANQTPQMQMYQQTTPQMQMYPTNPGNLFQHHTINTNLFSPVPTEAAQRPAPVPVSASSVCRPSPAPVPVSASSVRHPSSNPSSRTPTPTPNARIATPNAGITLVDVLPSTRVSSLLINEEVFQQHIQDQGVALSEAKKNSKIVIQKMAYYELYKVSKMLDDIYNTKENAVQFPRIPKSQNRSQVRNTIGKWINTLRNRDDSGNFVLSQDVILYRAKTQWGPKSYEDVASLNDKVRLFGIVLQDCNSDDLLVLMNRKANPVPGAPRDRNDNPSNKKSSVYAKFATQFNSNGVILLHPTNWPDAYELDGYDEVEPNEQARILKFRDSNWVQKTFQKVMVSYKKACTKYKTDTGGGSGQPKDFAMWDEREDKNFAKYGGVEGTILTWIFMMDRERGFILEKQPEQLPDGAMKDGKSARERKKGSGFSTGAALTAITDEMKNTAKETNAFKTWMMDTVKKQYAGEAATRTETAVTEADEEKEELRAINADMQLAISLQRTSDMIASLQGNGTDLRHCQGSPEDEEAYNKKKRERLEAFEAIEARLLRSAKRRR